MSVSGIYISPRNLVAFSVEFLWFAFSGVLLVTMNSATTQAPLSSIEVLDQAAAIVAIYVTIFFLMDLYDLELLSAWRSLLLNLVQAAGLFCVVVGAFELCTRLFMFDPRLVFSQVLLTAVFAICTRALIVSPNSSPPALVNIVAIAGASTRHAVEAENRRRRELGISLHWIAGPLEQAVNELNRVLKLNPSIRKMCVDPNVLEDLQSIHLVQTCRERGLKLADLREFAECAYGKAILGPGIAAGLEPSPIAPVSKVARVARRARDLILACLGLVVTMPLTFLTVLAIRWDSPGAALFRQDRIGENGRTFTMFKFRSMYAELTPAPDRTWTTQLDDPRVTRVGRIIRELHIDEIPQLVNVIKGEMSLVGPRPFHPDQVAELESTIPSYGLRHRVRPGITGWAQIRCDYGASIERREEVFARDLYYVKHMSFVFDLMILLDTARVCIWRRGAR